MPRTARSRSRHRQTKRPRNHPSARGSNRQTARPRHPPSLPRRGDRRCCSTQSSSKTRGPRGSSWSTGGRRCIMPRTALPRSSPSSSSTALVTFFERCERAALRCAIFHKARRRAFRGSCRPDGPGAVGARVLALNIRCRTRQQDSGVFLPEYGGQRASGSGDYDYDRSG